MSGSAYIFNTIFNYLTQSPASNFSKPKLAITVFPNLGKPDKTLVLKQKADNPNFESFHKFQAQM